MPSSQASLRAGHSFLNRLAEGFFKTFRLFLLVPAYALSACSAHAYNRPIFHDHRMIPSSTTMQVPASIFKAYDIRGVVPSTLTADIARGLGRAFGTRARQLGSHTVAVGRDGRLSGPELVQALVAGLIDAGVQVIDVGMVTTPMLYFAAHTLCDSGIQVTGSHNPKDHNGFKMVLQGRAIYGDEIQALRQTMEAESWQLQDGGSVR